MNKRASRPFAKVWEETHGRPLAFDERGHFLKSPETFKRKGKHTCCRRSFKTLADVAYHKLQFHGAKVILLLACLLLSTGCHRLDRILGHHDSSSGGPQKKTGPSKIMPAGQSNSVSGYNAGDPWMYSLTGRVAIEDVSVAHPLSVPTESTKISNNFAWLIMGDRIAAEHDRDVEIYNQGHGNTSTRDWVNLYAAAFWQRVGEVQPDDILWVQGESENRDKIGPDESYQNLRYIFDEAHRRSPSTIIYIALDGGMGTWSAGNEPNVRLAQKRMIAEGRARQGPDIDVMRRDHPEWFESSGAEFTGGGFKGHADAWYAILQTQSAF